MKKLTTLMAATALTATAALPALAASHSEKWDMPMAYSAYELPFGHRWRSIRQMRDDRHRWRTIEISDAPVRLPVRRALTSSARSRPGRLPIGERLLVRPPERERCCFGFDFHPVPGHLVRGFRQTLEGLPSRPSRNSWTDQNLVAALCRRRGRRRACTSKTR